MLIRLRDHDHAYVQHSGPDQALCGVHKREHVSIEVAVWHTQSMSEISKLFNGYTVKQISDKSHIEESGVRSLTLLFIIAFNDPVADSLEDVVVQRDNRAIQTSTGIWFSYQWRDGIYFTSAPCTQCKRRPQEIEEQRLTQAQPSGLLQTSLISKS